MTPFEIWLILMGGYSWGFLWGYWHGRKVEKARQEAEYKRKHFDFENEL